MQGTNKLELNQETMCAAVQEYLVARMPTTPIKVDRVEPSEDGSQGYGPGKSFLVTVSVVTPAIAAEPR